MRRVMFFQIATNVTSVWTLASYSLRARSTVSDVADTFACIFKSKERKIRRKLKTDVDICTGYMFLINFP